MKILVLSDSHGDAQTACLAVEKEQPHMIFFLGDGWRDSDLIIERFPDTPLFRVPGNCDYFQSQKNAPEQLVALEGFRILLCHGHTYGVKQGLWEAEETAKREHLDAFLFGHTHSPLFRRHGKTLYLNPGSIGMSIPPTYGVLNAERGKPLNGRIYRLK
ncbi:MAG: metallophosphoesterase [Oscillibacter sp.]|nr:metallophosphoesterase [Oscillibacter sp.]